VPFSARPAVSPLPTSRRILRGVPDGIRTCDQSVISEEFAQSIECQHVLSSGKPLEFQERADPVDVHRAPGNPSVTDRFGTYLVPRLPIGQLVTVKDLAARWGVCIATIYSLAKNGSLESQLAHPEQIAVRPDGMVAYVTNEDADTVSVIDTFQGSSMYNQVISNVIDPNGDISIPEGIAFTPDGAKAYVVSEDSR
jgi:YVTN family beta-propeller protein